MKINYKSHLFFSSKLIDWYEENQRVLPWRLTNNPYFIWISEIILQQTRVEQGLPYYLKFVENYPLVQNLAFAPQDEILKCWQGLGYYSRARNLHEAAKSIVEKFNGDFPTAYKDVLSLKGVGDYTAAAIMSFAYNKPYATVDGNVFRVLSRLFGVEDYIDTSTGKKVFTELANELLDKENPGIHNQAIMDFGSLQCVPKSPNCATCPFVDSCVAYNTNKIDSLPRKRGKVKKRNRYFNYLDIHAYGYRFLRKRKSGDIWEGLYEFPLIETNSKVSFDELLMTEEYHSLFSKGELTTILKQVEYKHILSHQNICATFYQLEVEDFESDDFIRIKEKEVEDYGMSRLIEKYILER